MKNKTFKKLVVAIPAFILGLLLLNSFVQTEKISTKACAARENKNKPEPVKIVLKSTNGGQTWQKVCDALPGITRPSMVADSDGVLLATGQKGIKRSTDNGKTWDWVISEGGVGIAVERITGGFAAISYSTTTKTRRIRISSDGINWKAIDEGLPPSSMISSIKEMGNNLICGHPEGIMLSSDRGATWKKVAGAVHSNAIDRDFKYVLAWNPVVNEPVYVFRILVLDNVLFAVSESGGC